MTSPSGNLVELGPENASQDHQDQEPETPPPPSTKRTSSGSMNVEHIDLLRPVPKTKKPQQ
jgi:hypothetical protein